MKLHALDTHGLKKLRFKSENSIKLSFMLELAQKNWISSAEVVVGRFPGVSEEISVMISTRSSDKENEFLPACQITERNLEEAIL